MPFYEAGQNAVRSEAVIRALSEKVLVLGPEGYEFLVPYGKGGHEQAVLDAAHSKGKLRVVGFRVSVEQRSSGSVAPGQSGLRSVVCPLSVMAARSAVEQEGVAATAGSRVCGASRPVTE